MIILLSLFYVYYYSFTIYYCFSILVRHRIANVMLLRLSIPPLFFKKLYKSDSKKKIYVNENKLPKSAGPHLLRNVLTWAVKQRNHRMIIGHLTCQIKTSREAIFSTDICLFKTLFSLYRIRNLILDDLHRRYVK